MLVDDELVKVWLQQIDYNDKIRKLEGTLNKEFWTQIYLLGITTEIDEVLQAINWKRHRRSMKTVNKINLAYELADLTKYVMSLWELWGFTPSDMLHYVGEKSDMLETLLTQEFQEIPTGVPVIMCDIDGTLGDWRKEFMRWLNLNGYSDLRDTVSSILMDSDIGVEYPEYFQLKEEFEASGGYRKIPPYPESLKFVRDLKATTGAFLIVYTARPNSKHHRIWSDTWHWLRENGINPDQFHIGAEDRILLAKSLLATNPVVMLEDDPALILRAAKAGIKVIARRQPYNERIIHENIRFCTEYSEISEVGVFEVGVFDQREYPDTTKF